MKRMVQLMLLGLLGLSACKPIAVPPAQQGGNPVFQAELQFAGGQTPVQLQAGVDDYYLFTSTETADGEVQTYSGWLQQLDCQGQCGPQLIIRFRDVQQAMPGNIEAVLNPDREIRFQQPPTVIVDSVPSFQFTALADPLNFSPAAGNAFWSIDNDTIFPASLAPLSWQLTDFSPFELCLSLDGGAFFCNSETCRTIDPTAGQTCAVYIDPDSLNNSNILMAKASGGLPPYSYNWQQGATAPEIFANTPGTYCVTVTDAVGCTSHACLNVSQGGADPCSARFAYDIDFQIDTTVIVIPNPYNLGSVQIDYLLDGKLFRSQSLLQPSASHFTLLEVQDYQANETGLSTKLYRATFNCILHSASGDLLEIEEGVVTFGVGY